MSDLVITERCRAVESILGYTFKDIRLLKAALTHTTYQHEHPEWGSSYERLEFLGDAVLDLVVAELLFHHMPSASEGELSEKRIALVRRETLALLAKRWNIGNYVWLGAGQHAVGGINSRILADVYEALIGAVCCDGGYSVAYRIFSPEIEYALKYIDKPIDFKTLLQQYCHKLGKAPPIYRLLEEQGPPHQRRFTYSVDIEQRSLGIATGPSKKTAEQSCAQQALLALEANHAKVYTASLPTAKSKERYHV